MKFLVNVNGWRDKSDPQAPQKILSVPQNAFAPGYPIVGYPNSPQHPRAADWTPGLPQANHKFWQASLRSDIDLTDAITLTSITSFSDLKFDNSTDTDGTALEEQDILRELGRIKSFSQELRLSNGDSGRFRWTVGANYENTKVYDFAALGYADATSAPVNGISIGSCPSSEHLAHLAA
jgi:hypothetical protein